MKRDKDTLYCFKGWVVETRLVVRDSDSSPVRYNQNSLFLHQQNGPSFVINTCTNRIQLHPFLSKHRTNWQHLKIL